MRIIEILTGRQKNKEKAWIELGKKYGANQVKVYENGEEFIGSTWVSADFGYKLTWATEEDDIHVGGDGTGVHPTAMLVVDTYVEFPESMKKLEKAIKAYKEINENKKKYFHI